MRSSWSWAEDRQWARSRIVKNWNAKSFIARPEVLTFDLEVRTEDLGAGTQRMGELLLREANGLLLARLREENI